MKKFTFCLTLFFCLFLTVNMSAQSADVETEVTTEVAPKINSVVPVTGTEFHGTRGALIYDNGPFFNVPGSPNISLLEDQTLGMNTLGNNVNIGQSFSLADDVTLTADYEVDAIDLYCYQTNAPNTSTVVAVSLQVWDGDPSDPGSSVIWGDLSTDLLDNTFWPDTYRHSESNPGTARAIFQSTANTTGLTLSAGTYWLEWTFMGDGAFSGPWGPPISILGQGTTGNAMQHDGAAWTPLADSGTGDLMGAPFQMYGTEILGVNDVALDKALTLFPNPAQSEVTISNNSELSLVKAEIYNIQGRLMQTVDLSSMGQQETINVSSYSAGVYLVNIEGQNGSVTKRFVKK